MKKDTIGIYVHIPFCKSKCNYCDFCSYPNSISYSEDYIESLCKEIELTGFTHKVDTIYIGGGTPTYLPPAQILRILDTISEKYSVLKDAEITIECNPATIDFDGLSTLRKGGINRLSIGLQSTDDDILKRLGRAHSTADFEACYHSARQAGFDNISIDLMFGLPGQSMSMWIDTLNKAISYGAEHISCYSLKVEEGTPFYTMNLNLPDDDTNRDMYDRCVKMLADAGYERYEISNFAKPNCKSQHNIKYWECNDFAGFGAAAYSCMEGVRYSNICGLHEYISAIKDVGAAPDTAYTLTEFDQMSEFVFLGLRMCDGISQTEFEERFQKNLDEVFGGTICKHLMNGHLIREDDRIKINPDMLYVSNSILADFV